MSQRFDLILKNTAKYILLNPEEADFFTSLLEYKSVKRKEYLLKEGDVCRYETFVIKGCLRNYSIDKNGVEHIGMFAMEDWWTGDLYSFMTKKPSVYNIEALKDTEVFQLSKESQEKLLLEIPKFEKCYRIKFQNSFISLQQRMMQRLSDPAEERYLQLIIKYPQLEQEVAQKYIASYLGITPEFLSVLRGKLAKG